MEVPLRDIYRVKPQSLVNVLKYWKASFSVLEKVAICLILLSMVFTSWRWAVAASGQKGLVPDKGGVFVEGVVCSSVDKVDLGRLTKSALLRRDTNGQLIADLATKWEVSENKLNYDFTLIPSVSAYEFVNLLKNNPTYLTNVDYEAKAPEVLTFHLKEITPNFLESVAKPIFPLGPYTLEKKLDNGLRLKINKKYHLQKPYIEKFEIKVYPDKTALEKAASRGEISGAFNLSNTPGGWQQKNVTLGKKHILFVNLSKSYLKQLKVREKLFNGEKPDSIKSLDILEVNGEGFDPDYEAFKQKLKQAGIELNIRKVALAEAISKDLPKRDYDMLYLLINDDVTKDPYTLWHSSQRNGSGENFSEIADADLDKLTQEYRSTNDNARRQEVLKEINEIISGDKIAVEYKNIEANYAVSSKVKGYVIDNPLISETNRFDFATKWFMKEKREF